MSRFVFLPDRMAIVARARFLEDLVAEAAGRGVASTSSWEPDWTRSRSGDPSSHRGFACSRSTRPVLRRGSGAVSSNSASASRTGSASCLSTSG